MNKKLKFFLTAPVIIFFILTIILKNQIGSIVNQEIIKYGLTILPFISALLEFIPQYISPHLLLINSAILNFPMTNALIRIIIGSTIGSILGFEVGKKFGRKLIKKLYGEKTIQKIKNQINKKGKWVMLIAAISPLPYIPMIFGTFNITRKSFLIFGLIPRIIGLLLFSLFFLNL